MSDKIENVATALATALDARVNALIASGKSNAARNVANYKKTMLAHVAAFARFGWDVSRFAAHDSAQAGYVAVYTLEKIADIARTLDTKRACVDMNVRSVFCGALEFGTMSNPECNVAVSRVTHVDGARIASVRGSVAANTAGTQASYARSALEFCGIGQKLDRAFKLNEKSAAFRSFRAILAPEPAGEAEMSA